jgi:dihydroorotate dehydrogenase electron transfer subunit
MTAEPAALACYADRAAYRQARIVDHRQVADHTYRLRVECPEIASVVVPGQFAMVRIPGRVDPLLARPLAIYDTFAEGSQADFVYLVHGKFTTALKDLTPGEEVVVWGPLGNGFSPPAVDHLVLVAGGIGQTALLALGRERLGRARYGSPSRIVPKANRVTFCWGARHAGMFGGLDDFRGAGMDVHLATLDGSTGRKGTVVDLLDAVLGEPSGSCRIACCGPEPMMAAVTRWAQAHDMACDVSLEAPMACGIGICFTCVAPVRDATGAWDYRRTCIEGPVFDGSSIAW